VPLLQTAPSARSQKLLPLLLLDVMQLPIWSLFNDAFRNSDCILWND
jgi:hypothetical protein